MNKSAPMEYEKAIEFNLCFDIFLCRFVFGSEHLFDG